MTKKELAQSVAETTGLSAQQTHEVVGKTFEAILQTLLVERRLELRGFGVFAVVTRAARRARNPRTGERLMVPAKLVATFTPSKEMKERIRGLPTQVDTPDAARIQPANSAVVMGNQLTNS